MGETVRKKTENKDWVGRKKTRTARTRETKRREIFRSMES